MLSPFYFVIVAQDHSAVGILVYDLIQAAQPQVITFRFFQCIECQNQQAGPMAHEVPRQLGVLSITVR
jgi:hypothetical protein